jgi:ribosomal protein L11 methylase PrmA
MSKFHRDEGSFRDPSGYIFQNDDKIIRAVMPIADADFKSVYDSGIIQEMSEAGLMISCDRLDADQDMLNQYRGARNEAAASLYEHPKVPMITYPYEWVFSQLKDAALAHLDIQIKALKKGYELSDATAYNMQFINGKAVHIDVMSLRPYVEGAHWAGYNQFCRQFLLPLLLEAWAGVSFQPMYRGSINGISFEDALSVLPRRKLFTNLSGFMHVYLHGRAVMANSSKADKKADLSRKLPKSRYEAILEQMHGFVTSLESAKRPSSYWKTYAKINSYSEPMRDVKLAFVEEWARENKPELVWDIGGNTGDFSLAAIKGGAKDAVILDGDLDSLETAYRLRVKKGEPLLPLLMNLVDPSPNLGWRQTERKGLQERAKADGVIALAVIHHMCIAGNLPLGEAINWLVNLAPSGIIEFVPKRDPMVSQLLEVREDIFFDYEEDVFRSAILKEHDILKEHLFEENGRLMVSYKKRG